VVLARAAAARLREAACKNQSAFWNAQEAVHGAAETQAAARVAAWPLVEVCHGCPVVQLCAEWASVDRYTGIAAGAAWVNGRQRPLHWVRRQAPRRLAS
jgi:hypothetical protein